MAQAPLFERMLIDSGISVTKYWFSVTGSEQRTRFIIRQVDPVRQWKLSPMDLESLDKWDAYTEAKEGCSGDRHRARPVDDGEEQRQEARRINAMRHFLSRFDYEGKDADVVGVAGPARQRGRRSRRRLTEPGRADAAPLVEEGALAPVSKPGDRTSDPHRRCTHARAVSIPDRYGRSPRGLRPCSEPVDPSRFAGGDRCGHRPCRPDHK